MIDKIRVKVHPPTGQAKPGRGFYQLEEDALYFQIVGFEKSLPFFSFLESDSVRLEIDRRGRLIFIEVTTPRRQWTVDDNFLRPSSPESGELSFLDFRRQIRDPRLICDRLRRNLRIAFSISPSGHFFRICQGLDAEITDEGHLATLFISDIEDDLAGQELTGFRRAHSPSA